jgi:hypothetical protein
LCDGIFIDKSGFLGSLLGRLDNASTRHGEGTFRGLMMIEMVISTEVEYNGFMNNKKRRLGEQGMWIQTSP